jgi:hypothetical protein
MWKPLGVGIALAGLLSGPPPAWAQDTPPPAEQKAQAGTGAVKLLAGAAAAFLIHESGHLAFDAIFDARPRLESVHFGPVPFFAITPTRPLSSRQLFTVASAGFWAQEISSEWLLPKHRDLRHEDAPFAKGMLAFGMPGSPSRGQAHRSAILAAWRPARGFPSGPSPSSCSRRRCSRRIGTSGRNPPGRAGACEPSRRAPCSWSSGTSKNRAFARNSPSRVHRRFDATPTSDTDCSTRSRPPGRRLCRSCSSRRYGRGPSFTTFKVVDPCP